jgi:peptidoglycan/LPS O-acetylase OafA/YrhL
MVRDLRYPAIDGLRFYAAFLVFLTHLVGAISMYMLGITDAGPNSTDRLKFFLYMLGDGNHGVDLFFIISGFLMGRIVLNSNKRFNYTDFIGKRIARIYPAFLISYLIYVAYCCGIMGWNFSWPSFFGNFIFLNAIPTLGITPYNYVSWSLGYEFAFYLILPIAVLGLRYFHPTVTAVILFTVAAIFLPDTYVRMLGLFAGAIIGTFDDFKLRRISSFLPVSLIVAAYSAVFVMKYKGWVTHLGHYWQFLALGSALFVKVGFGDNILSRVASWPTARFLGTLSYSFYLFHVLCINVVLFQIMPVLGLRGLSLPFAIPCFVLLSLGLALVVAALSYVLLERTYFSKPQKPSHTASIVSEAQRAPAYSSGIPAKAAASDLR